MNNQQIDLYTDKENYFSISVKKPPKILRITLILTILISILLPVILMSIMIIQRTELKIQIFLAFGLFWGIAYYLFRVFSWNNYGKEFFEFDNKKISYYADFKYFKDNARIIDNKNLMIEIIESPEKSDDFGFLRISNKTDKIESCIKVSMNELVLLNNLKTTSEQHLI